jgi:hypothetical protein
VKLCCIPGTTSSLVALVVGTTPLVAMRQTRTCGLAILVIGVLGTGLLALPAPAPSPIAYEERRDALVAIHPANVRARIGSRCDLRIRRVHLLLVGGLARADRLLIIRVPIRRQVLSDI